MLLDTLLDSLLVLLFNTNTCISLISFTLLTDLALLCLIHWESEELEFCIGFEGVLMGKSNYSIGYIWTQICSYLTKEWKVKRTTEKDFTSLPPFYPIVSLQYLHLLVLEDIFLSLVRFLFNITT